MGKLAGDDGAEQWSELGDRIRVACPERYEEILRYLRMIADAQEILASHDAGLVLRARRPSKRYTA